GESAQIPEQNAGGTKTAGGGVAKACPVRSLEGARLETQSHDGFDSHAVPRRAVQPAAGKAEKSEGRRRPQPTYHVPTGLHDVPDPHRVLAQLRSFDQDFALSICNQFSEFGISGT